MRSPPAVGMRVRTVPGDATGTVREFDGDTYRVAWDDGHEDNFDRTLREGGSWGCGNIVPISPAPAEPAKAAGWVPKASERCFIAATVHSPPEAGDACALVEIDGSPTMWRILVSALRPEAAPPAAAERFMVDGECVVNRKAMQGLARFLGKVGFTEAAEEALARLQKVGGEADATGLRMQLADSRSKRDQYEALSVKRELELGDKEREIARLRSALRDATAKLQRRGPL